MSVVFYCLSIMAASSVAKLENYKFHTRNAICRLKNGSLRILNKDVLKKKIVERIRRDRDSVLNFNRNITDDVRRATTEIVEEELTEKSRTESLSALDLDLLVEEQLEREAVQEYEDFIEREIDQVLYGEDVVCPVCCRSCYNIEGHILECVECHVKLSCTVPLHQLRQSINSALSTHSCSCTQQLAFTYIPDCGGAFNLMAICVSCYFMNIIT